ncbi:MAG: hypothetical protein KF819_30280 [Labilithrix sp.]|nr:hypothetical protein [Labilithrix sp.]
MHVVACQKCGAGLPPPDGYGRSSCAFCATVHSSPAHEAMADLLAERIAEEAARIPMTDDAVLGLVRQYFAGAGSMYFCPNVPPKKEHGVRRAHVGHLPTNEWILGLYDDTVFGSSEEGFVITSRRLCWKNIAEQPCMLEWQHLDPERMYPDGQKLVLGAGYLEISGDESVIDACADAFHILAISARATPSSPPRSHVPTLQSAVAPAVHAAPPASHEAPHAHATPPPPNPVSFAAYAGHAYAQPAPAFACWHCRTPLYWNTPQCARCSAWPSPQGWLRTG